MKERERRGRRRKAARLQASGATDHKKEQQPKRAVCRAFEVKEYTALGNTLYRK